MRYKFCARFCAAFFVVFSCVFSTISAQEVETLAAEEGVLTLRQIDRYINDTNNRDFQKALLELNKYLTAHPEQFDAVQRRFRKIFNSREHYVQLSNELMRLIRESSEEDSESIDEQMMNLTERILRLERYPKDSRLEIVKDTNYLVSIRKYSALQNKTGTLAQDGKYNQAVQKAAEGFAVLRDNFDALYSGDRVHSQAVTSLNAINSQLEKFYALYDRLLSSVDSYINATDTDNDTAATALMPSLSEQFAEFAKIRNEIIANGLTFASLSSELKKNSKKSRSAADETDAFLRHADEYLPFAYGTVFGWSENPAPEHGIIGAMDSLWNNSVESLKEHTVAVINRNAANFAEQSSVSAFRENSSIPGMANLSKISAFAECALSINGYYALCRTKDGKSFEVPKPNYAVSLEFIAKLAEHTESLVQNVSEIAAIRDEGAQITAPENSGTAQLNGSTFVQDLLLVSGKLNALVLRISGTSGTNSSWGTDYHTRLLANAGLGTSDPIIAWQKIEAVSEEYVSGTNDFAYDCDAAIFERIAWFYSDCGIDYTSTAKEKDSDIQRIVQQSEHNRPNVILSAVQEADRYIDRANSILGSYSALRNAEYARRFESAEVSINQSIQTLNDLRSKNMTVAADARRQLELANERRTQAENLLSSARRLYNQKQYDQARDSTNRALDEFRESLKYSYDEGLESSSEESVVALLTDIDEAQKLIIENEVNTLIAQANREYRADNYTKAQDTLNAAQERWNVIFQDYTNYEITNLLAIVENALSANSGREVLASDTLYFDVSQMLRGANQNFSKGQALAQRGDSDGANAEFDSALQTLEILRSLVPRNREANILRFKIMQFQNPAEFETDFSQRVSSALQEMRSTTNKTRLSELYGDLSDLAEIKPDYPGLKNNILELEYVLGKRERPNALADAQKEAAVLARQARTYFQNGNYSMAFDKINQAIAKDSSNAEYKNFRTRVNRARQTVVSIKSADYSDKINEINERVSASDINGAYDIVEELWKNTANRTDELKKMRQRIERMRA